MARLKRIWNVMYNVIVMPDCVMGSPPNRSGVKHVKRADTDAPKPSRKDALPSRAALGRSEVGPR